MISSTPQEKRSPDRPTTKVGHAQTAKEHALPGLRLMQLCEKRREWEPRGGPEGLGAGGDRRRADGLPNPQQSLSSPIPEAWRSLLAKQQTKRYSAALRRAAGSAACTVSLARLEIGEFTDTVH
jgi:hypothetical protein